MNKGLFKEWALVAGLASAGLYLGRQKGLAAFFGLTAAGLACLPGKTFDYRDKVVLITGGSRGLGMALAAGFLQEGAKVGLLARDADELLLAQELLITRIESAHSSDFYLAACDVTDKLALTTAIGQVKDHFGRLDVLVNNAGTIAVGPFETMERADYDALLNLQVHAVVDAVQAALPAFLRVGEGRVVNICSIGGQLPVPHMATYCAGKFALAGLSETMAAELAPHNIKVTTVYPGLMRTGSPIQAIFKGDTEKEYAWFQSGDVLPGVSVSADEAARHIIEGTRNGDAQVVFPLVTKLGILGHSLLPETFALIMRTAAAFFPKGQGRVRKTGAQSQQWLDRRVWYKPLKGVQERAELRFNQQGKTIGEALPELD